MIRNHKFCWWAILRKSLHYRFVESLIFAHNRSILNKIFLYFKILNAENWSGWKFWWSWHWYNFWRIEYKDWRHRIWLELMPEAENMIYMWLFFRRILLYVWISWALNVNDFVNIHAYIFFNTRAKSNKQIRDNSCELKFYFLIRVSWTHQTEI